MREKLQTLPLTQLKEIAKSQGMKGLSGMKKSDIIDLLCRHAEEVEAQKTEEYKSEEPAAEEQKEQTADKYAGAEKVTEVQQPETQKAENQGADVQKPEEKSTEVKKTEGRSVVFRSERRERPDRGRPERPAYRADRPDRNMVRSNQANQNTMNTQNTQNVQSAPVTQPDRPVIRKEIISQDGTITQIENSRNVQVQITPQIQAQFPDQSPQDIAELDSGIEANGILEVMPDGFGFIRCENFLPGENDVYVAPSQIRRFNMKTGDIVVGSRRIKTAQEKFAALLYIRTVNGLPPAALEKRPNFEDLTPIFPNERLHMETPGRQNSVAMRVLDLLAPVGKGQRGLIVSPPKAGKTTLLKQVAQAITSNNPDMHLIILLIDERPEEVTDVKESVFGKNVEIIYSTFDELPERHKRVSEMVVERARRLVEHGRDVTILLDSITRLARAYNLVVPPSGRTLSGGLDPTALHMPKRFFGAARNMREGGSLTILATALVDTGSRMDDVIYEEFKSTGNMELVLDRKLSEKRIFPAIDILKSGTRNDHLLLSADEKECVDNIRKATNSLKQDEAVEQILNLFARTRSNREFIENAKRTRFF